MKITSWLTEAIVGISYELERSFFTTSVGSIQCPGMSDYRMMKAVRKSHIHPNLSLAILHAVLIVAVTFSVILSAPIYG